MDKVSLIQSIYTAFKTVRRPSHDVLFLDGWETYQYREQAFAQLVVDDWRQIKFKRLARHRDILGGLTPEWFVFLLPAFLTKMVENFDEADVMLGNVQFVLTPPVLRFEFDQRDKDHFTTWVLLLTRDQCHVIRMLLRYYITLDPDEAIYDDNNIRGTVMFWDEKVIELAE